MGNCPVLQICDGFDEYADKIRKANALPLVTSPPTERCDFAQVKLCQTTLQFGSGAAGTIVHGKTCSDAYLIFMQSREGPEAVVFDGRIIKWPEIVIVPPDCNFSFASAGATQWISMSVPTKLADTAHDLGRPVVSIENNKTVKTPTATELKEFINGAAVARQRVRLARPRSKIDPRAIERSLLRILQNTLSNSLSDRCSFDKRTERIILKVLECLQVDNRIPVLALAEAASVSERTLHRAFKKYFHIGPKRYLKIRQLNLVRNAIRQSHPASTSVTDILAEHGVTEFGRFATEYKALFNESPTETLQKHLALRSCDAEKNFRTARIVSDFA